MQFSSILYGNHLENPDFSVGYARGLSSLVWTRSRKLLDPEIEYLRPYLRVRWAAALSNPSNVGFDAISNTYAVGRLTTNDWASLQSR